MRLPRLSGTRCIALCSIASDGCWFEKGISTDSFIADVRSSHSENPDFPIVPLLNRPFAYRGRTGVLRVGAIDAAWFSFERKSTSRAFAGKDLFLKQANLP